MARATRARAPLRRDGCKTRDALLDAALACFARRGVLATGIDEIRRTAGVSASSVYHFFDGLADLTLALLTRTFERLFAHLTERVTAARSAKGVVLALVGGHLEWILDHAEEGRFMYQAMSLELAGDGAERLRARKDELLVPIAGHVGRFVAAGELPAWSPLELDVVLLGPSHEACRRFLGGAPLDPAWMKRTLPRLAWHSVTRS